jgi:hypothetical protein
MPVIVTMLRARSIRRSIRIRRLPSLVLLICLMSDADDLIADLAHALDG